MRMLLRAGMWVFALGLAILAGWRIVVTHMADRAVVLSPQRALEWEPHNPAALLALAEHQLADQQPQAAAATARELLRVEPLMGQAFVVLADAAQASGDTARALALHAIALRRAPRDLRTRAWTIGIQLTEGAYADALINLDMLLRVSPTQGSRILPLLARLAETPAFALALAHTLSAKPAWRDEMLLALLTNDSHVAMDQVYSALQREGGLSNAEAGQWFDRLVQTGQWGEGYARWAGSLALPPGAALGTVYDGSFESDPSGLGFDWSMRNTVGVMIERVSVSGSTAGHAARVTFLGRRVPEIDFGQLLYLAPGAYRLRFRASARSLLSDKGLDWVIACHGSVEVLAQSPRIQGSFDWKSIDTDFVVPAVDCPAQRLWLRNPGADGSGKIVSGTVWFDDFAIDKATTLHSTDTTN